MTDRNGEGRRRRTKEEEVSARCVVVYVVSSASSLILTQLLFLRSLNDFAPSCVFGDSRPTYGMGIVQACGWVSVVVVAFKFSSG